MLNKSVKGDVLYHVRDSADELLTLLNSNAQFVIEQKNKPALKLVIRLCNLDDFDRIIALQKQVYESLPDKQTFVMTTGEELLESLQYDICLGAFHFGELIAFSLMVINPYSSRNLGLYLDYEPQQCAKCVTYDTTFVSPTYQGFGLQRIFIKLKDKITNKVGMSEVLATVSPDNAYSLHNLVMSGFVIVDRKKMYGDFDRYIIKKQIR
jgi:hypothetical protein